MKSALVLLFVPFLATGCGGGTMHFPGGGPGCFTHCASANMEMDSFVYVGDYSTACVCRLKAGEGAQPGQGAAAGAASGAAAMLIIAQQQQHAAGAMVVRR